MADLYNIAGRIHSTSQEQVAVVASEILDTDKNKMQSTINSEVGGKLSEHESRLNAIDGDNFVTVDTYSSLPASGAVNTIYRVANWDGGASTPAVDASKYSEYAWDGTQYVLLCVKSQIDEVFDISVFNAVGGTATEYADLSAALGTGGANVPSGVRRGGMSVKFIESVGHKYVQYRLMSGSFSTTVSNWQGIDDEPTVGSDNLVKSGGINMLITTSNQGVFKVQGNNIIAQNFIFYLKPNSTYRVDFPITNYADSNLDESQVKFGILYRKNEQVVNPQVVSVLKGETLDSYYEFTTPNYDIFDYCAVYFRANIGEVFPFSIKEVNELELDAEPTYGSNNFVNSYGILKGIAKHNLGVFQVDGADTTGIAYLFNLKPNTKYQVDLPVTTYNDSNLDESQLKFGILYRKNEQVVNPQVVFVTKGQTLNSYYEFTTPNYDIFDYCTVYFRANVGEKFPFAIKEVNELELDAEPTYGSNNFVNSYGILKGIAKHNLGVFLVNGNNDNSIGYNFYLKPNTTYRVDFPITNYADSNLSDGTNKLGILYRKNGQVVNPQVLTVTKGNTINSYYEFTTPNVDAFDYCTIYFRANVGTTFPFAIKEISWYPSDYDKFITMPTSIDNLPSLSAALSKMTYNNSGVVNIGVFGASWVQGIGNDSADRLCFTKELAKLLYAKYGYAGLGWYDFGYSVSDMKCAVDSAISQTQSGTIAHIGGHPGSRADALGLAMAHSVMSNGASFTLNLLDNSMPIDKAVIWFYNNAAFTYSVNGGTPTQVTATSSDGWQSVTINTNITSIILTATTDNTIIFGIDFSYGTKGIKVHKIGNRGASASDAISVNAANWESGLSKLSLDTLLIGPGLLMNEIAFTQPQSTPSQTKANIATIINRVKTAYPRINIGYMLSCNTGNESTLTEEKLLSYNKEMNAYCMENSIAKVPLQILFGTKDQVTNFGLNFDKSHPNAIGAFLIALYLKKCLFDIVD